MNLSQFALHDLTDMREGRPNLGQLVPVGVYRLMQYTFRDVLEERHGLKATKQIFFAAGDLAGKEFCKHILNTSLDFDAFMAELQQKLEAEYERQKNAIQFRVPDFADPQTGDVTTEKPKRQKKK